VVRKASPPLLILLLPLLLLLPPPSSLLLIGSINGTFSNRSQEHHYRERIDATMLLDNLKWRIAQLEEAGKEDDAR